MRFAAAIVLVLALTGVAVWLVALGPGRDLDDVAGYQPVESPGGEPVTVVVEPGAGTEDIANNLQSTGAIASATQFRVLVAFLGYDQLLQTGEYEFTRGTSELDAVYRMRRGQVSTRTVTVVEGWRIEEIADAVSARGIPRNEFIVASRRGEYEFPFLEPLGVGQKLEGYLFPATYTIRRADKAPDVVQQMLQAFADNVPPAVEQQGEELGLSLHEIVTLASIIEREAVVAEERPIMAQVFLRRLQEGMRLEADPTVQYAVANVAENPTLTGYWEALSAKDLEAASPYNTYRQPGLPPGPIASPRLDSINAVVNPADTNYLYFFAKEDGSHAFAETLQEHLENIEQFSVDEQTEP